MTLLRAEQPGQGRTRPPHVVTQLSEPARLRHLRSRVDAAVLVANGADDDPQLSELVTSAIAAFVEAGADPRLARSRVRRSCCGG